MCQQNEIPTYSLNNFRSEDTRERQFQVEVFDANRHFEVSYPHKHDFYEVLFLTKGSGIHIIDSNEYRIQPPCVFFLTPGQAHRLDLSHDIEGFIFLFTAGFYLSNQKNKNRLLEYPFFFSVEQRNPPLFLKQPEDFKFFVSLFERGVREMKANLGSEEILRSLLDVLLLSCDQLYPEEYRTLQRGRGHVLVKSLLLLIEENYQKNLRINDYADMLAVTPNHLTQMVRQVTGKTSTELLQEKVLVETKRLLLHTNMSVTEIAELLSFPDQSYFTKYFKKQTGITPLVFRKKSMKST